MSDAKRTEIQYGRYTIYAAVIGTKPRARAHLGKRIITESEGASVQDVILKIKEQLDQRDAEQTSGRKDGVPAAEEYQEALELLTHAGKLKDHHYRMLEAHYRAKDPFNGPPKTLTAEQIADAVGYQGVGSANLQYGKLGRLIAETLNYKPSMSDVDDETVWTFTLATGKKFGGSGLWIWTMRPELAIALERLGIV